MYRVVFKSHIMTKEEAIKAKNIPFKFTDDFDTVEVAKAGVDNVNVSEQLKKLDEGVEINFWAIMLVGIFQIFHI